MSARWIRPSALVLVTGLVVVAACTQPGIRGRGDGRLDLGGTFDLHWTGTCTYEVHTRWSTPLPHVATLAGDGFSLEVGSAVEFAAGRYPLVAADASQRRALLLEDHTVRGAVDGSLDVQLDGDDVVLTITGTIDHRDRGDISAACRWR